MELDGWYSELPSRILLPPFPRLCSASLYRTDLVFPPCLILFPSDPVSLTIRVVFVSNWSSFTGERGQVFQTVWNYLEMKRRCVFRPSRLWIYACCSKQPRCYRRLWRLFWVRYINISAERRAPPLSPGVRVVLYRGWREDPSQPSSFGGVEFLNWNDCWNV